MVKCKFFTKFITNLDPVTSYHNHTRHRTGLAKGLSTANRYFYHLYNVEITAEQKKFGKY